MPRAARIVPGAGTGPDGRARKLEGRHGSEESSVRSGGHTVVAILAVPRAYALDVSIAGHVFGRHPGYRVLVCGDHDATAEVRPTHSPAEAEYADIVVVPGYEGPLSPVPEKYLAVLRAAAERGARVVAVCTGVFALAAGGILKGKTVTTHWRHTEELRLAYPEVEVVENRLFVEDGSILTSAGAGAGIDACLHVVQADFGTAAADGVAKDVVFSPVRGADEPQYTETPTPARDSLRATQEWAIENMGSSITVQRMADHSMLSRRTFIRRFVGETGLPPMQWVVLQRLLRARRLLETSDWTVERIATETGFGTSANFRAIFRRDVGPTPTAYRKAHGARTAPSGGVERPAPQASAVAASSGGSTSCSRT
ncbi:GlxA family transcriptional regulator [Streptomyces sp. NPDC057363]|uniref:GlxA family transcriptional regulator n=1 Tax=Streptomyces sp. NPDC057363 TaxID=3346107 RepID=UPI00362D279C